ncbi:thiosulfate ABC transporter substrate-binding protein CysP [Zobellella taiwanensis]|jgi:sulfate transport system substrate-binding protein|uniref:Sulfate ABC transporter substrate-binding protein n=1 Tax=Zobellella taiwanensis TaxID=347535 RepID=A0A2P7QJX5_9GAMM|nr:thiosulfate ABC transporter substrate-binding protein CysP [Zobellella taiwanensis]PSJ38259.1 sulfate ABC transporter substrate-binding protein [Zobellella taiwanensis]
MRKSLLASVLFAAGLSALPLQAKELLNSSYDIARELFAEINPVFVKHWQEQTGETLEIKQSHAGSSRQAQAILQGLRADVVTYNQVTDVDVLHQKGDLIPADWKARLPNDSSPYFSTMAFLVRKDNPKNIKGWEDLGRDDVQSVLPNPKTSGNGRYSYLAAWGAAHLQHEGDEEKIREQVGNFIKQVAVFDTGGRGATTTFVERGIGDVLITFESEVNNIRNQYPDQAFEVVVPPVDVLAEFPVTWIDRNVERNGTADAARAYLEFLYTPEAQRILANYYYRVHNEDVAAEVADRFPATELFKVEDIFGSWEQAMQDHFANGGSLDQLQARGR